MTAIGDLRTLWVIDDEPAEHALFRLVFREYADTVALTHFRSTRDALERLEEGGQPEVVLVDVNMPGGGAEHLLREMRNRCSHSPVVLVMSSYPTVRDTERCYDAGASSVLEKPDDLPRLREFADSVVQHWFRLAEMPGLC